MNAPNLVVYRQGSFGHDFASMSKKAFSYTISTTKRIADMFDELAFDAKMTRSEYFRRLTADEYGKPKRRRRLVLMDDDKYERFEKFEAAQTHSAKSKDKPQ